MRIEKLGKYTYKVTMELGQVLVEVVDFRPEAFKIRGGHIYTYELPEFMGALDRIRLDAHADYCEEHGDLRDHNDPSKKWLRYELNLQEV